MRLKFKRNDILVFFYGLFSEFSFRLFGIIYISELISFLFFPIAIIYTLKSTNKAYSIFIILFILWLLFIPISDLYNNSNFNDSLKGFFGVLPFFSTSIFAYYFLNKNIRFIIPFIYGYSISLILSLFLGVNTFFNEVLFYQGGDQLSNLSFFNKIIIWCLSSLISLAFAILIFKKHPFLFLLLQFVFSIYALLNGSRSIFLINFLTFITALFYQFKSNFKLKYFSYRGIKFMAIFLLFVSFFISVKLYDFLAQNNLLDESEVSKYEMQKNTDLGLLAGRGEFVASYLAIMDSPFLGHGSYAKDHKGYGYTAGILTGNEQILNGTGSYVIGESLIPTHSHLWFGWVNYGIIGAFIWIYIIFSVCIKYITNFIFSDHISIVFNVYAIFSLTWSILFSPFSERTYLGFIIVYFILTMKKSTP